MTYSHAVQCSVGWYVLGNLKQEENVSNSQTGYKTFRLKTIANLWFISLLKDVYDIYIISCNCGNMSIRLLL